MFTIYSLTYAVWCGILYIELRERTRKKTLTNKNFKVATLQQKGLDIMKINGTEVKGVKKAVGEYRKYADTSIIYDCKTHTVACVSKQGLENHIDEKYNGYYRYVDLVTMLDDISFNHYEISMSSIRWLLDAYVI